MDSNTPAQRSYHVALITGCDRNFFPLLRDFTRSVEDAGLPAGFELCLLDMGLDADQLEWAKQRFAHIEQPRMPLMMADPSQLPSGFRGQLSKPFLPEYFPGFRHYLWIDADTWIQQPAILRQFVDAAGDNRLSVCPEYDIAFLDGQRLAQHLHTNEKYAKLLFGRRKARILKSPNVNSGVFCLSGNAPHWNAWKQAFTIALRNHPMRVMTDQCSLNYTIFIDQLPVTFLPMRCNWPCSVALPAYDPATALFVEPYPPFAPIQIVHRTAHTKQPGPLKMATPTGGNVEMTLDYPGKSGPRAE